MFHPQTAFFLAGLLYVALPLTAWSILRHRHDGRTVMLWCVGGGAFGAGMALIGLRGVAPGWASYTVANLLIFASYVLKIASLRRELGLQERFDVGCLAWALVSLVYVVMLHACALDAPRVVLSALANLVGACFLTSLSWRLYRMSGFRSAAMLAGAYALFALAMAARVWVFGSDLQRLPTFSPGLELAFSFLAAVVTALYGNLGFIGIALESVRKVELARTAELSREQETRRQLEMRSQELSTLLAERTQLLSLREEMLGVMAHEVRQPLNNASAALQSAAAALAKSDGMQEALLRVNRASHVLMQVSSSLDNVLTDAALLDGREPLMQQETDLDTLVALVLADVSPADRPRVKVVRATATRTADMNANLLRLALRNLVLNALRYAPVDSVVTVRLSDSDQPLGVCIDVCDSGPGFEPELVAQLFVRGARGRRPGQPPGHGLGLYIAQRVMRLHGGQAVLLSNQPGRSVVMRLVWPQGGA